MAFPALWEGPQSKKSMTQPTAPARHTLRKSERVCSRTTIETLFGGGHSRAMSAFPLRMVYMLAPRKEGEPAAQIMVSVSKRWFKRAVKRNRVKRQVREAYRMEKHTVTAAVETLCPGQKVVMAFIFTDGTLHSSATVGRKVAALLARLADKLTRDNMHREGNKGMSCGGAAQTATGTTLPPPDFPNTPNTPEP